MTLTREADRNHMLAAEVLRVAGHLGRAGTACPQALPSMKTWRHQANTLLSVYHSQLLQHLPDKLLYLGRVSCIMHAYDASVA